jgi:hypothetical protein
MLPKGTRSRNKISANMVHPLAHASSSSVLASAASRKQDMLILPGQTVQISLAEMNIHI